MTVYDYGGPISCWRRGRRLREVPQDGLARVIDEDIPGLPPRPRGDNASRVAEEYALTQVSVKGGDVRRGAPGPVMAVGQLHRADLRRGRSTGPESTSRLGGAHPRGSRSTSRPVSAVTVEVDQASLSQPLRAGRNRRDVGGEVLEELRYAVALRTGPDPVISLRATVSGTVASVPNNVLLTVPVRAPETEALYAVPVPERLMAALVEAWGPDWCAWISSRLRRAQQVRPGNAQVG